METPELSKSEKVSPPAQNLADKQEITQRSEIELESFNPILAKLQTLLTVALPAKQESSTEEVIQSKQEKETTEKPFSSAEIREKLKQIPSMIQSFEDSFYTSIKGVSDEVLPLLQQLNFSSEEDIIEASALLDTAISKAQTAKDSWEKECQLGDEHERLKAEHNRALLKEANIKLQGHYESFDQLEKAQKDKARQADILSRQKLSTGKFFNREKIKQLDKEYLLISSFLHHEFEVDNMRAYPFDPLYSDPDKTLAETTTAIARPIIEKLLQRYDKSASQLRDTIVTAPEISPLLRDSLDNDFINKYFLPYLKEKTRENHNGYPNSEIEFTDPKIIQEAVDIVRQSLRLHHDDNFSPMYYTLPLDDRVKNKELQNRLGKLPPIIQDAIKQFYGDDIFSWNPTEENYQTLAHLVKALQGVTSAVAQAKFQKRFLNQIESLIGKEGLPSSIQNLGWTISERWHKLPNPQEKMKSLIDGFLRSIDSRIWFTFLNNADVQQVFGVEQLNRTNLYLAKAMIEKIMTQDEGTRDEDAEKQGFSHEEVVRIGYRLLDFKSHATIPLIILNIYRDPESFMGTSAVVEPQKTMLFKFVSKLTEQELEQLKQENIPGLLPLIGMVKFNPGEQWLYSYVFDEQTEQFHQQLSKKMIKNLMEMSLYLSDKNKDLEGFTGSIFDHYSPDIVLEAFCQHQQEAGDIPLMFTNALIRRLRKSDPLLREQNKPTSWQHWVDLIPQESYERFHKSINYLLKEINNPESKTRKDLEYLSDISVLRFIARQPERVEEVLGLPFSTPYLFSVLLKEGGPLFTNRNKIMENIFSNGNALKRAKEIETIFSKKIPYWKQLYLFTDARIGEQLATATSEYPITDVIGIPLKNLIERHKAEKAKDPEVLTRLQSMIKNPEVVRKLESGELDYIPFAQLNGGYKRLIFRDLLKRSIETSRNSQAKVAADSRNRTLAGEGFSIPDETYIHGSAVDVIESVLLNGNLPQEALGEGAGTDSYPFQTDFSCLTEKHISSQPNIEEIFNKSISGTYGSSRTLGQNGQLFYIYRRTPDAYEGGKKYGPSDEHTLILGGMPATEISGIALRNSNATLETVKKAVLENGFYIPVYDLKGSLLFTPEDYDSLRTELNYTVPVEVWDYSLKTGEQLGSNPGGEFTVPTKQEPIKYYVKFANPDGTDQIWNEQLADNIYRHLGIAVPDTKIVKIDTTYGHSSQLLPHDQAVVMDDLRNGFLADALLANWDVAANFGNVISSGGRLIRIDNGGALLFRARGERKSGFGGIVTELESMKGSYLGLTQEDIQNQLSSLREKFTDGAIDQLVDSVRLSTKDRDYVKTTLRQRRDYIFAYYNSELPTAETREISEQARAIDTSLRAENFDETKIREAIPEWEKLTSEEGYQHNGVLLGDHIRNAVSSLKYLPEYWSLSEREKSLALVATLFHDIGKPTGRQDEDVPRDFEHEIPSAQIAAEYMRTWGYSDSEIRTVVQVIINDGIVSDIVRGKVRDERKNLTPEQFRGALRNNPSAIKILRALNRADVIATVGTEGFNAIANAYNQYFDQGLS